MLETMIERIKEIVLHPAQEWAKISKEKNEVAKLLLTWVLPLLAITLVFAALGGFVARFYTFGLGLSKGIVYVIFYLIVLFAVAFAASKLAPQFGGKDDFPRAFALAVYSMTPAWLVGVFYIIPNLGSLLFWVASLYGLYILYLGIQPMMKVAKDKTLTYFIVLILVWIIVSIILFAALLLPLTILVLGIFDPAQAAAYKMASAFLGAF